jgi:hypothetical protein
VIALRGSDSLIGGAGVDIGYTRIESWNKEAKNMQKWEYLYLFRERGWKAKNKDEDWHKGGRWNIGIVTATEQKVSINKNLGEDLAELGE